MNEKFARWSVLFIQYVKRDWKKIIVWILGLGLFQELSFQPLRKSVRVKGFLAMFETMKNPAMISMVGPTPIKSGSRLYTRRDVCTGDVAAFAGLFAMIVSCAACSSVIPGKRKN